MQVEPNTWIKYMHDDQNVYKKLSYKFRRIRNKTINTNTETCVVSCLSLCKIIEIVTLTRRCKWHQASKNYTKGIPRCKKYNSCNFLHVSFVKVLLNMGLNFIIGSRWAFWTINVSSYCPVQGDLSSMVGLAPLTANMQKHSLGMILELVSCLN